jgi:hypothetical protein
MLSIPIIFLYDVLNLPERPYNFLIQSYMLSIAFKKLKDIIARRTILKNLKQLKQRSVSKFDFELISPTQLSSGQFSINQTCSIIFLSKKIRKPQFLSQKCPQHLINKNASIVFTENDIAISRMRVYLYRINLANIVFNHFVSILTGRKTKFKFIPTYNNDCKLMEVHFEIFENLFDKFHEKNKNWELNFNKNRILNTVFRDLVNEYLHTALKEEDLKCQIKNRKPSKSECIARYNAYLEYVPYIDKKVLSNSKKI